MVQCLIQHCCFRTPDTYLMCCSLSSFHSCKLPPEHSCIPEGDLCPESAQGGRGPLHARVKFSADVYIAQWLTRLTRESLLRNFSNILNGPSKHLKVGREGAPNEEVSKFSLQSMGCVNYVSDSLKQYGISHRVFQNRPERSTRALLVIQRSIARFLFNHGMQ